MKLSAGTYYRTRSGGIAFVAYVGCPFGGAPIDHAAIGWCVVGGEPEAMSWSEDGFFGAHTLPEGPLDLVDEMMTEEVTSFEEVAA